MSSRLALAVVVVCFVACPRPESAVQPSHAVVPADAGVDPELAALRQQVTALSNEVRSRSRALDEQLWAHWTTGAPLDLAAQDASRAALVTPEQRALVARALARRADDPVALEHLALFLDAERLALETSAETAALSSLEGTLTFPFEGKDVRFGELSRLLATEKSALKRKALWQASLPAAAQLDALIAARDAKAAAVLAPKTPLAFSAELRDVELEELRRVAEGVLLLTSEPWRLTLERLNAADTKLPIASLTRADLPRLLRVPADVELAFGKKELASRAIATLGGLGLYGQKGLTLELSEAVKKNPLPLTVTPGGPADVRTSFRPLGGLRDQQLLLSEVGVALALQHVTTGRFETERLGDTALAQATGELFASLVAEPAWLEAQGVLPAAHKAIIDAWQVQRLFQVRRAAASFLVRLTCLDPADPQAPERAAAIFTRALGVTHTTADMVRLRLDTDDALRSATTLRAMLLGEQLRVTLSASGPWFSTPESGKALRALWSTGSSVPAEAKLVPLGDALTAFHRRTLELTPVGQPVDGGVLLSEPPAPKQAERPTFRAWPRARITELPVRDAGQP